MMNDEEGNSVPCSLGDFVNGSTIFIIHPSSFIILARRPDESPYFP